MSNSPHLPDRRDIWRLYLFIVLGLLMVACLFWIGLNLLIKHSLARYEQERKAMGEHFNFADFIPRPVPDESNFALVPVVASSFEDKLDDKGHLIHSPGGSIVDRLDMQIYDVSSQAKTPDNGNWALGQTTDLKAFQDYYRSMPAGDPNAFPVAEERQSPAVDVLLALSKYDETIEELRQAAALPDSRFPLNYDSEPPADILLPHLAGLRGCSRVLELRAVAELRNGQSDLALADVKLI